MKSVFVALCLVAVVCGQARKGPEVTITRSESDDKADGTFNWASELSDGSKQEQSGFLKTIGKEQGISLAGSYSFTSPDGKVYTVNYIADENGFQPTGDHLPKPNAPQPPKPTGARRS